MIHSVRHFALPARSTAVLTFLLRWLKCPAGRGVVQALVLLLSLHGWPLQTLSHTFHWQPPAWITALVGQLTVWAEQGGAQPRITELEPDCAPRGTTLEVKVKNFNATPLTVIIGGVAAPILRLTKNSNGTPKQLQVTLPPTVPQGVAQIVVRNTSGQNASKTLRVKQPEVCGDEVDDDCDDDIDDDDDEHGHECTPVNHAPVAHAGPDQTWPVGSIVQLDGSTSADPDGNQLTFSWLLLTKPSTSSTTLSGAATTMPTLVIDKAGSYTLQLIVSDGHLTSSPDTVVISTVNSAPVADAGPDQTGVVHSAITLDGRGSSDIDGDALTYAWAFVSSPAGSTATLTNPTSVTPSFTLDVAGEYRIQLVVRDGALNSSPDTVTISTLNSPPVANAGPDYSAHVNEQVTLDGTGSSDVDGDTLTYAWSLTVRPSGSAAALTNASSPTPSLTIDKAGTYVAQLIVNDGLVNSAIDTVTISTVNSKPVANAGGDQHGVVGALIQLDGSGSSDVDGDSLTYQWSFVHKPVGSTATLTAPPVVNPIFTLDRAGEYLVQLLVHDGVVASEPVTVTISTLNSKPAADAGAGSSGLLYRPTACP